MASLAARLDQVDSWIADGLLGGAELNAADFQIASAIALLVRFDDLAPFIEGRPAAQLAQRVAPDFPGEIGAVLPAAWLAPLRASASSGSQQGPMGPEDMLRAIGYDNDRIATVLSHNATPLERVRHG